MTNKTKKLVNITVNGVEAVVRGSIASAMVSPDLLVPSVNNPNQMDTEELRLLKETIEENGFIDPISVIPLESGKFAINGGEHRWRAAKDLGLQEIPIDILYEDRWQDEDLQKFQLVRFNVLHGKMNPDKFITLYNSVIAKYGKDKVARLMGYTSDIGINKLIKQVSASMRESLPADLAKKFDEEAKTAKTAGDLNKIIRNIFEENGDSVDYGFMVFSFSGKEHVYVSLEKTEHEMLKKMLSLAKKQSINANDLFRVAFTNMLNQLGDSESEDN